MREVTAVVLLASERGGAQGNLLLFTSKFNLMHILLCSFVVSSFSHGSNASIESSHQSTDFELTLCRQNVQNV